MTVQKANGRLSLELVTMQNGRVASCPRPASRVITLQGQSITSAIHSMGTDGTFVSETAAHMCHGSDKKLLRSHFTAHVSEVRKSWPIFDQLLD